MAHKVGRPPTNGQRKLPAVEPVLHLETKDVRAHLGDFFQCVADTSPYSNGNLPRVYPQYGAKKRLETVYKTGYVQKESLGEGHGVVGGYLVPEEMSLAIMRTIAEESFLYSRAEVVPMGSKTLKLPKVNVESTYSAGTNPLFGGLLFKWGSAQAPQETEPTFGQLSLDAWDLLGYCVLSNQFLADAGPEGEQAIVRVLGKAAAWYTEYAFFQGTGSAQLMPLGIINAPGTIGVSRHTSSSVQVQDIATMTSKFLPSSWSKGLWAVAPSAWVQIAQIANYYLNEYAKDDDGQTGYLLNRPVFTSDKMSVLGTAGDVALIDPSLYVIGMRQEVLVDVSSDDVAFKTNQTTFRVWLRADGKCFNSKSITLADGSSTASPFIILV